MPRSRPAPVCGAPSFPMLSQRPAEMAVAARHPPPPAPETTTAGPGVASVAPAAPAAPALAGSAVASRGRNRKPRRTRASFVAKHKRLLRWRRHGLAGGCESVVDAAMAAALASAAKEHRVRLGLLDARQQKLLAEALAASRTALVERLRAAPGGRLARAEVREALLHLREPPVH
mmetsp:Transcript_124249/g.264840  ORF Transcript_124249/g.264840 Transcript_124249/m.264840 type:complete len:175 (-) Transcript_124249:70-594(-)